MPTGRGRPGRGARSGRARAAGAGAAGPRRRAGGARTGLGRRPGRGPPGGPRAAARRAAEGPRGVAARATRSPPTVLDDILELAEAERVPVREVGRGKFFAEARCEAPQGVLAKAAPLEPRSARRPGGARSRRGRPPFLVAVDGVTDPGNLGALLRSAECAGATGIVLPRHRAVHVTPTVTKAAAGAVEHLPFAVVGGLPDRAPAACRSGRVGGRPRRRRHHVGLWDLPAADGPDRPRARRRGHGPVAPGPPALRRGGRHPPARARWRSLNVAAAAALACFEVARPAPALTPLQADAGPEARRPWRSAAVPAAPRPAPPPSGHPAEPGAGIEPTTSSLQERCSTS